MWGRFKYCLVGLVLIASCGGSESKPDARVIADASVSDARVITGCQMDSQCDDGLYCTGVETCLDGQCVSGTPVTCDDGIACTQDVCSNQRQDCTSVAPDVDADGHGDANCLDEQNVPLGDDCDDNNPSRFPGNVELCDDNHQDEDCDETTFGNVDSDSDGFFSASCCNEQTAGGLLCGDDCDDVRNSVRPGVAEVCDGLDNNCNGDIDEGDGVRVDGFADMDSDGFGDINSPISLCAGATQFSSNSDDCDDADQSRYPGQAEICDGLDNDCDPDIDENSVAVDWYEDNDLDGFGNSSGSIVNSCNPQAGRVVVGNDCDDDNPSIHPAAAELCDGLDNNCNGVADFQIDVNDFEDDDGDGFVDMACAPLGNDCDDNDGSSGPGGTEQCDGQDNDCDDLVDENANESIWYRDIDEDGYGSVISGSVVSCFPPQGYSTTGGDCNDNNTERNPGADDTCNAQDDDCDSAVDESPAVSLCPDLPNSTPICSAAGCSFTCDVGFEDCDGTPANGCEVDLSLDGNNCGSCGQSCSQTGQNGTCSGGVCSCADGLADCNGLFADGCEIAIDSNDNHCGACFNDCSFINAINQCNAGTCEVSICIPGWGDCSGDLGCETQVNSLTQCGSCGNDCTTLANTDMVSCDPNDGPGGCDIEVCSIGFDDCNNNDFDGCEAQIANDGQNCGGCNNNCSNYFGTTGNCSSNQCECQPDFLDCDAGQPGCEVDRLNDNRNCGSCGNDCNNLVTNGNGLCTTGTCDAECWQEWGDCGNDGDALTCETRLDTIDDCGSCGNQCFGTNGTPDCQNFGGASAQCYTQCDSGYQDCDADPTTCEIDTFSDPENCGNCGNSCGVGGTCSFGGCDSVIDIAVGQDFTCALRQQGAVVCWGNNDMGQLGMGATSLADPEPQIVVSLPSAFKIFAGGKTACAQTATGVYCWGDNTQGQVGNGSSGGASPVPSLVTGLTLGPNQNTLSIGRDHVCAVDPTNNVVCWGDDGLGQLGDGAAGGFVTSPQAVGAGALTNNANSISSGDGFSCATAFSGDVYCWGANANGELGNGTFIPQSLPTNVPGYFGVDYRISAGTSHVCAMRNNVFVDCWGAGGSGQLGQGAAASSNTPIVANIVNAFEISMFDSHSCAMLTNSEVYCWGDNTNGQIGQGSIGGEFLTALSVLTSVQRITQGGTLANHTCVIDGSQRVQCWGFNGSGQTGQSLAETDTNSPTLVPGL